MTRFAVDGRIRLAIELALTAEGDDELQRGQQDAAGRRLGMSIADVDAARRGWSLDVRISAAIALAMAWADGDAARLKNRRERAARAGIGEGGRREIEAVAELVAGRLRGRGERRV